MSSTLSAPAALTPQCICSTCPSWPLASSSRKPVLSGERLLAVVAGESRSEKKSSQMELSYVLEVTVFGDPRMVLSEDDVHLLSRDRELLVVRNALWSKTVGFTQSPVFVYWSNQLPFFFSSFFLLFPTEGSTGTKLAKTSSKEQLTRGKRHYEETKTERF
ncbi:hypothetical protein F7725_006807 [Dissostichus mawsoni]|uniref:Uncharacterized protein n=1 Tax=Dissostichus mawsoni TaxID=36200 RepID=A0A7J5XUZ9_DISMA|nr:hypothetical protein F7725_006807 [Dissostichus mawsoni]